MSDKSDASVSPTIHKGKRKAPLLTDSDADFDSSVSDLDVTVLRRSGKRKNRIHESDSDSSIEKPRKLKRVPRVTSDSGSSNSDESDIIKTKKPARVVSDDSSNSDSDTDVSGASDNGFEDNTSDEWESDWISESEIDQSQIVNSNEKKDSPVVAASTSINLGNISDSSDGESEKCPICLLSFNTQEVGTPETCDHSFCADCIQEWSKNVNTCPVDRQTFTLILVRKRYNGKVIRTVPVDVRRPSVDELIQEDPTFCEICGMSDREDRLLLCDGCDLGYHLECLDPPMDTVPIEEWFCNHCRRDESHQQPQRGNRGEHRLLPRTMQSERIRATIETNRNNSAFNVDQQSLSSGFEDVAMPGPSRTSSARSRSRSIAPTRKHKLKKTRKSYKKKKRARFTVTYDICEITGEKIAIKKKRKSGRKRKTKRKVKRSTRRVVKPKTVKKRLAYQLGMCPPKKAGLAVPEVKIKSSVSNSGNIGYQRSQAGIPTLHLFGQRDQLDYFSESDDEATVSSGGGGVGVLTQIRISSGNMGAMRRAARRKAAVLSPVAPISVNSIDILSSIMDSQEKLHSKNSVISVSRDGTLRIEQNEHLRKSEKNNNDIVKPNTDVISQNSPLDISSTGEIETTQAPMFPGRGGSGGNRQPYGFHNRGGYRGGDNRYEGGSGGGYNHFQGSGPRGRGGYGQNMYNQRDNNFGGGYMNFHHHSGGPPPPFRGRGGPRFPTRRPQVHQQQPQAINQREEPVELNLDEPMEQNVSDDQSRQQEEDVDIYSDIEAGTPVPDDEVIHTKPVGEPEPTLVSQAYNNSGSDDDSGSELIIDDSVKETDKYDPTQPSADTDSNSEPPLNLNVPEPPIENIDNMNISEEKSEEQEHEEKEENSEVELPTEAPKITSFSTEAVNEAVQQVIKEHLSTPTKSTVNDNDDDDDAQDDEDCPNFSIYSSTSIDIAKSSEISVDIPNQNDNIENEKPEAEIQAMSPPAECESQSKDPAWESGDEWDAPETETNQATLEKSDTEQPPSPQEQNIPDDRYESAAEAENVNDAEATLQPEEETDDINQEEESQTVQPDVNDQLEDMLMTEIEETEAEETDKMETAEITQSVEDEPTLITENDENGDESPKPDCIAVEVDQLPARESTTPPLDALPTIPLPEEGKEKSSRIKIAFTPGKKYQPDNNKKERVLQLYDDSDWEEWESKNEVDKSAASTTTENVTTELDKMTEAISEEERSYTPCLDEREPAKGQFSDEERNIGAGIGGMDTELISDEERNDMFDESHDMKTISDGDALEINAKESELDMTRPEDYEEGEIIEKLGAKKAQDSQPEVPKQSGGSEDDKSKKRVKKKAEKEPEKSKAKETDKQAKKPEFKKISKSNKDRNYRDKEKGRSKSKERKDKENKENRKEDRKKKERKRDLERYNVRSIIAEKPKKDQFGRDINKSPSRSSRSLSPRRSRSHSWNRAKRRRRRSRSPRRSRSRSGSRGHTPRSRSRGKSLRRSRSFRRSRSPRRSRSKSFRRSRSPRSKRHRLEYRSSSRDRDRSRRYRERSRRRSTERLRSKKKNRSLSRTRLRTRTPSLSKHRIRGEWARSVDEPRRQSYTREWTPSWSRSPTPPRPVPRHNLPQSMSPSWTPPLIEKGPVQPENLTVILTNEVNKTKKKEKKKKGDKKSKDEYRKRKRGDRTPPPSKEVFASGDNILVSVSFNKTNEENAVATREVTGVKRKRDEIIKKKKDKVGEKKKKRAKSPRTKKKNKEIANLKPVAIIDLDRSPFKEITPSPKDIIVLSDSDNCEKEDEVMGHHDMMQEELMSLSAQIQEEDSAPQSPTANYLNSTGPKTPPEPQIKFLLTSKQTQLRQINNPLHDPNDENEPDIDPQEELEHRLDDVLHKGPNTPPEPPSSPPSSPDAYDPFDPTKSRSATPELPAASQPINSAMNTPGDKTESDGDLVDLAVGPLESSQKSTASLNETSEKRSSSLDRTKRLSSSPERTSQTLTPPVSSSDQPVESSDSNKNDAGDKNSKSPERNSIGVVINQQVQPAVVKPIIPTPSVITSTPAVPNVTLPRTNLFNTPSSVSGTPRIPASVPQRIILPTPAKSSPAKMSPLKTSPSKPPIKSTPIKPMPSKTMISKLPVPNMKPITPVRKGPQTKAANRNVGQNGNEVIDVDLDFESPYSPGSSDYEDLFEPPTEVTKNNNSSRAPGKNTKSPAKQNTFDNLFGSSPVFRQQNNKKSKTNAAKIPVKMNKKSTPTKAGTKTVGVKIDEDNLKILDDLPNSAVEMQVKDKFLKKLNRQERVVEEVKLVLKPHYNKKHVTKEQYKDILRRAVPKICHNRSGEINPKKIQNLIEAYVKKARHAKKAAAGGAATNAGAATQQPKPFLRK